MPQDGTPSSNPSVDVLAAQVREALEFRPLAYQDLRLKADAALDALVARAEQAEERHDAAMRQFDRCSALQAERDALVARVTAGEERWYLALQDLADTKVALADARNALERIAAMPYGSRAQELARDVLARLDGSEETCSGEAKCPRSSEEPHFVTRQIFICGATQTYYGDESGWWKYDWLRRKLTRGGSPRIAPLRLLSSARLDGSSE